MVLNDHDGGVGSSAGVLPSHQAILYGGSGEREESAVMHIRGYCALWVWQNSIWQRWPGAMLAYFFSRRWILCRQLYNTMSWYVGI